MTDILAEACAIASSYCWQRAALVSGNVVARRHLIERARQFGDEATARGKTEHPGELARKFLDSGS